MGQYIPYMENIIKITAITATRILLRQIASVLLKCGVTWKEFSDLSKWVFVDVASKEFGIKGRDTNVSRVSILTGISRKEIKRQRELKLDSEKLLTSKTSDAARILFAWHHDPDFIDRNGLPRVLTISESNPSFKQLHDRYGGDIPLQAMLKELIKTGAVQMKHESNEKTLTAIRSYFVPKSMDKDMLFQFGQNLRDHAATLNINVTNDGQHAPRFEGVATVRNIDKKYEKDFRDYLDKKGQNFLDEVDAWLNKRTAKPIHQPTKTIRLGVGAYAIHDATN